MNEECKHGLPVAAECADCDAYYSKEPTPQQLLSELMDAAGVYNDGSTPAVLWARCIDRVKNLRVKHERPDPRDPQNFSGRSWS